ncbi:MAG: hypothetical protein LGR52_15675 [Candidatus Thiosymbion ectosymbiont of Robbea hypermnestra]|nr:hypothetical protein [Candidatus Thiosymbion ectosymbiont of Robbea hypermnestra]
MKKTKWETADRLARRHFEVEPNLKHIFLLEPVNERNPSEPIKLLEIVEGTIERGIEPITFAADPTHGVDYPSMIIEVSPSEFRHIRDGRLGLQDHGWTLGKELRVG